LEEEMAATTNCFVLDITKSEDHIVEQLRSAVEADSKNDTARILELNARIKKLEPISKMNGVKVEKRSEIYERMRARMSAKHIEYERARNRVRTARDKHWARITKQAECDASIDSLKTEISRIKRRLEHAATLYEGDAFERRALMLKFVADRVDTSVPITVQTVNENELTVKWKTSDIYIKDGFGGTLPFNFGSFQVHITYKTSSERGNRVDVYCYDAADNDKRADYSHPHLNEHGHACLGNLAPMLLKFLGEKDIVGVIEKVTEFLQHYNRDNPYIKLENWCENRWDNAICESGRHILADCTCPRCAGCRQIFETPDIEISACGHCPSCCMVSHIHVPTMTGVNGTHCINRAEYRHVECNETSPAGCTYKPIGEPTNEGA